MHRLVPAVTTPAVALWLGLISLTRGQSPSHDLQDGASSTEVPASDLAPYNLPLPTLGGGQFWGDLVHYRGWRIQEHVYTRHCRLLDPQDIRQAWGTRAQCRAELQRMKELHRIPPLRGKAVVLIHGIIRSSHAMARMEDEFTAAGYTVVSLDYPSTQVPIPESAAYLRQVIESLDGVEQIDFVVHSLGGLIVRSYLQQTAAAPDPRLHRMVMLGTPNRGAELANLAQDNLLFRTVFGPAGQQLVAADEGLIAELPTPAFPFACIVGGRGNGSGFNPLLAGDDDGVVTVESALLPGAADSWQVVCWHSFLPFDERIISASRRFLETGCLQETGRCTPVFATSTSPQAKTRPDTAPVAPLPDVK